ncbi:MAG: AAA family ATPase [Acidimicrobiia bacterium]|nr:AAA family ATPase [Acidimicrobiia bacterium]
MGMRCTACGGDNRDDARFCGACGVRITARCATCDRELLPGLRFCDGCGAPVVGAARVDTAEQARKTLTIVFADLQGSTAMQEHMDPESVRALMGRYYAAMREAVERHDGKVVKFVGDGVMAVFGVPEVAEDDALRGLRSAVAMQEAFAPFAAEHGLALRVGVNTGEVVVDTDDADVVGDAVNVAARLEAAAAPGEILVGEDTWRLTRYAAAFDAVTALTLKGRATAVAAHRLLNLEAVGIDAHAQPFVGRNDELATLRELFDDVVERRRPRLATVIGSPGVGKSRLVQELRDQLADRAVTVRGRCDQNGAATFAPVAQLLEGLAVLDDVDADADDPEQARVRETVAALTGTATHTTPEETFWAVRRVLETAAARQPLVAVLDDVHWAEPLLLDLIEHLAEWLDQPVLLVVVARPELRELRPSLTELQGRAGTLVALEGLERQATEQLVREHLDTDHVPAALLDRLATSSDGNPLFVRELVRMLVDDGVIRRDAGRGREGWTLAVDAAELEVPPTIQSLLSSRLDRLRPQERVVLERAAVIGAEVYQGALVEIVPPELRPELDAVLESLRRKELLEPAGTYWIDERVLRFHHALIREAAYRRLLKESRARLHERVAAWLVAKTGGTADHDETIGFHLEQAQANLRSLGALDDHGRQLAADAATRLGAAAQRALDRDDLLAAAGLAQRAVDCLDDDDRRRADLLLTRSEALLGAGDVAAAGPAIAELQRLGAGSRRIEAWAACFDVQHTALVDPRSSGDAEGRLVEAASILDGAGDATGAAKAHRVHALLLARSGRVADCEAALDRALAAARAAGDRRQMTSVLGAAPLAALWGPSPVPRAGGRCLDVIRLVRITTGAPAVEATSVRCQAVLEAFRGRADAARSLIASARATAEELGLRHGLLEVELFAGIVELCVGDAVAAADHLAKAQEGFTAMGVTVDAAQAAALRGRAELALGRVDNALAHVATSEQLGGQDLKTAIVWRAVKAEILAVRGNVAEATELADAAVALATPTDALVDHADALAALAAVHAAAGDSAAARRIAAEARALYEQKGATALAGGLAEAPTAAAATATSQRAPASIANTASRAYERNVRAIAAGRLDEFAAFMAPDAVREDRRRGMGSRQEGRATNLESFEAIGRLGITGVALSTLAVRGERLAVVESRWRGDFEVSLLSVARVNEDGHADLVVDYDPAHLNNAIDELNELYLAELSEDQARCWRAAIAVPRAQNQRDWAALRLAVVDDIRVVDHRPAAQGTFAGADRFIDGFHAMVDVAPENTIVGRLVLAVDARCALVEMGWLAAAPSSASFEDARLVISVVSDDGRVESLEFFTVDQREDAWGRYRELSAPTATLDNAASAAFVRHLDLLREKRPEEAAALLASDMDYEDVRPAMKTSLDGRSANLEHFRVLAEIDIDAIDVDVDVVAVRGERLALVKQLWRMESFEQEIMTIVRLDPDGLMDLHLDSDPADRATVLEKLDELFVEQLDAAHGRVFETNRAALAAHSERRWDSYADYFTEEVVFVDHRLAGYGEVHGLDQFIRYGQGTVDVAPDFEHFSRRVLAIDGRCMMAEVAATMTAPGGGRYERMRLAMTRLGADGRIDRYETFDPEQLDLAWARYRELSAEEMPGMANHAVRTIRQALDAAMAGHSYDEFLARDVVFEDRRPGLGARIAGLEAVRAMARIIVDTGVPIVDVQPVAVRGENLAVVSTRWGSAASLEVTAVNMVRTAPGGCPIDLVVGYDPGDLATAMFELDEQYADELGDDLPASIRQATRGMHSHNRRDWDALRACFEPEVVFLDHRPAGYGEAVGVDFIMEYGRQMIDVDPRFVQVLNPLDWTQSSVISRSTPVIHGMVGGSYDRSALMLTHVSARTGRIDRYELFGHDQLDDAWARYRELSAEQRATAEPSDNAAAVGARVFRDALLQGDWPALTAMLSPNVVVDDRRRGFSHRSEGRDAVLELYQAMGVLDDITVEPVAMRGERLVLVRFRFGSGGFFVHNLSVLEADETGRAIWGGIFDEEDLDAALGTLERRFLAGEGAPPTS